METKADIGLIGLAVMGQNLVLNMDDHGYTVAVYNRTVSKVDEFLSGSARGTRVLGAHSLDEFVGMLKRPRRVMLMVKAGWPVDEFIRQLLLHLEPGDIIIDGGNSNYEDTRRRGLPSGVQGPPVYRHRGLRRRGGSPARSVHHARRIRRGLASGPAPLPGRVGQGGRGRTLLRLGR